MEIANSRKQEMSQEVCRSEVLVQYEIDDVADIWTFLQPVRKDILSHLPVIGEYFVKEVAPEDNPF